MPTNAAPNGPAGKTRAITLDSDQPWNVDVRCFRGDTWTEDSYDGVRLDYHDGQGCLSLWEPDPRDAPGQPFDTMLVRAEFTALSLHRIDSEGITFTAHEDGASRDVQVTLNAVIRAW